MYNICTIYITYDFLSILLFLQIWIVIKEAGVGIVRLNSYPNIEANIFEARFLRAAWGEQNYFGVLIPFISYQRNIYIYKW